MMLINYNVNLAEIYFRIFKIENQLKKVYKIT